MICDYHLHLTVHCAKGLRGKRNDGTSNPFVTIECDGQIGSTRVIVGALNPRWEEKFVLGLVDYKRSLRKGRLGNVRLRVWTERVTSKAFLGQVTLPLNSS